MAEKTSDLEKLQTRLTAIKAELDGELIPLGKCLGEDDEGLLAAMEVLSERITAYFSDRESD